MSRSYRKSQVCSSGSNKYHKRRSNRLVRKAVRSAMLHNDESLPLTDERYNQYKFHDRVYIGNLCNEYFTDELKQKFMRK